MTTGLIRLRADFFVPPLFRRQANSFACHNRMVSIQPFIKGGHHELFVGPCHCSKNEASNAHLASNIMIESLRTARLTLTGKATLAIIENAPGRRKMKERIIQPLWHEVAEKHGPAFIAGYLQLSA